MCVNQGVCVHIGVFLNLAETRNRHLFFHQNNQKRTPTCVKPLWVAMEIQFATLPCALAPTEKNENYFQYVVQSFPCKANKGRSNIKQMEEYVSTNCGWFRSHHRLDDAIPQRKYQQIMIWFQPWFQTGANVVRPSRVRNAQKGGFIS